ncbi:MAG: citrate/2-methylcitrate synthase [Acidimicrobiales bacterium]
MSALKGLDGIVVTETSIGEVQGEQGFYHYRHYSAVDLAESCSLEEVWYLLVEGELPTTQQLSDFTNELTSLRSLPPAAKPVLAVLATSSVRPIDALRTAVSAVGAQWGMRATLDLDPNECRADGIRLCSVMPTLAAALYRLSKGLEPVGPDPTLGHAANALFMLSGEVPEPDVARAFEQYLITTIDHGLNASTFTGRVIASTGADVASAVVGAIGALSGPLHGGAPSRVLDMLDELDGLDALDGLDGTGTVEAWVQSALEEGRKIMGFGHRLYVGSDPRAVFMRTVSQQLGGERVNRAVEVEQRVLNTLNTLKSGHRLGTNVEFYAGVVMERCGIDRELFTSMFACARSIGWCAHIAEQAEEGRLIRPTAIYVGIEAPQPIPRSR